MKIARMLFPLLFLIGAAQLVNGEDGNSQKIQTQISRDKIRVAVQGICPMTGAKLGSMGAPIKVRIGQEEIFLCCKGCLTKQVNPQHWATIHANFASHQAKCPVMNKALPKNPKWTIVNGQIVYICCPPCTKKLAAEPEKYLKMIDGYYLASLQAKQTQPR